MGTFGDDDRAVTRRELLGGAVAGGVAGLLGGAGTWALTRDREALSGELTAGALRLDAECGDSTSCVQTDAGVRVAVGPAAPPASGDTTLRLRVTGTAAHVWLRTAPPAGTALERAMTVTLRCGGRPVRVGDTPVEAWSLARFLDAFADGHLLTPERPIPADASRRVALAWSVPDDEVDATASRDASLTFAAVQRPPSGPPRNPWTGDTDD
jgi:hypothetical protein